MRVFLYQAICLRIAELLSALQVLHALRLLAFKTLRNAEEKVAVAVFRGNADALVGRCYGLIVKATRTCSEAFSA